MGLPSSSQRNSITCSMPIRPLRPKISDRPFSASWGIRARVSGVSGVRVAVAVMPASWTVAWGRYCRRVVVKVALSLYWGMCRAVVPHRETRRGGAEGRGGRDPLRADQAVRRAVRSVWFRVEVLAREEGGRRCSRRPPVLRGHY